MAHSDDSLEQEKVIDLQQIVYGVCERENGGCACKVQRTNLARPAGMFGADYRGAQCDKRYSVALATLEALIKANAARPTVAPSAVAAREEAAYWRRDAAARLAFDVALLAADRRNGRHAEARIRLNAIRSTLAALKEVMAGEWHARCEACAEFILPGQATASDEGHGGVFHAACAGIEDAVDGKDDTESDLAKQMRRAAAALTADDAAEDERDQAPSAVAEPVAWLAEASAPERVPLVTYRVGERDVTTATLRIWPDGDREWIDRDGRTTVTHHSYAAPTHWLCRIPALPTEPGAAPPPPSGGSGNVDLDAVIAIVEREMGGVSIFTDIYLRRTRIIKALRAMLPSSPPSGTEERSGVVKFGQVYADEKKPDIRLRATWATKDSHEFTTGDVQRAARALTKEPSHE